jgi:hypothetical protein
MLFQRTQVSESNSIPSPQGPDQEGSQHYNIAFEKRLTFKSHPAMQAVQVVANFFILYRQQMNETIWAR